MPVTYYPYYDQLPQNGFPTTCIQIIITARAGIPCKTTTTTGTLNLNAYEAKFNA